MPLIVAFVILAAYTYQSGLRAPALIAVVKDAIVYVTVIAAVIVIPAKLGGYGAIFDAVPVRKAHSLAARQAHSANTARIRPSRSALPTRTLSLSPMR